MTKAITGRELLEEFGPRQKRGKLQIHTLTIKQSGYEIDYNENPFESEAVPPYRDAEQSHEQQTHGNRLV